jgi:hypothetical protein
MLRSEHIPFNLFVPLCAESAFGARLLGEVLELDIGQLRELRIEYAPEPREEYLDDNTCFDAFFRYTNRDGESHALGIEVKYTERSYPYGEREKRRMEDPRSRYNQVAQKARIFRAGADRELRKPLLKQIWRNQLLGESMMQHPKSELVDFTSVLVYPEKNVHMGMVASAFARQLSQGLRKRPFCKITYEYLISTGLAMAETEPQHEWLSYLRRRYLF